MMKIALLLIGVDENAGGAERFFSDFFELYNAQQNPRNELFFITDRNSFVVLKKLGKLKNTKNVILVKEINNRFKNLIEKFEFATKLIFNRIDILHITSYTTGYYNRVKLADHLPNNFRPKIVVNIVDPELPYTLSDPKNVKYVGDHKKYDPLFNNIKIDAVYTWYKLFKEYVDTTGSIRSKPYAEAVKTRFSGMVNRAKSGITKKKEIIFAARLVPNKQPLFFIEALGILKQKIDLTIFNEWKFRIFGKGPLLNEVETLIEKLNLTTNVSLESALDLVDVFSNSTCFVSTQDYENFPSQSMNEAMVTGNVIISRNVGQTDYFVKDSVNGFLLKEDSSAGLADALSHFMLHPELHEKMGQESISLTQNVHTPENFISDIDVFWNKVTGVVN